MFQKLPAKLKLGDKIGCSRWWNPPEIYVVAKIEGERVWLMTRSGMMIRNDLNMDLLRNYDFEMWEADEKTN